MTTQMPGAASHLRDADFMRLLDGEETPLERSRNAAHLAACGRCAAEVQRLRGDADTVRGWLARAEFEATLPPTFPGEADAGVNEHASSRAARRYTPAAARWLRAAAVLLVLAAPVAAFPALREALAGAFGGDRDAIVPASADAVMHTAAPATIRFEPAGGTFSVRIDAAQATGTLRLRTATAEHAVLHIDGTTEGGPVVSASSLHIRNGAGDVADYTLEVPAHVAGVVVRIGERSVVFDASALRSGIEVPVR